MFDYLNIFRNTDLFRILLDMHIMTVKALLVSYQWSVIVGFTENIVFREIDEHFRLGSTEAERLGVNDETIKIHVSRSDEYQLQT